MGTANLPVSLLRVVACAGFRDPLADRDPLDEQFVLRTYVCSSCSHCGKALQPASRPDLRLGFCLGSLFRPLGSHLVLGDYTFHTSHDLVVLVRACAERIRQSTRLDQFWIALWRGDAHKSIRDDSRGHFNSMAVGCTWLKDLEAGCSLTSCMFPGNFAVVGA